jgi:hypothetical protein
MNSCYFSLANLSAFSLATCLSFSAFSSSLDFLVCLFLLDEVEFDLDLFETEFDLDLFGSLFGSLDFRLVFF